MVHAASAVGVATKVSLYEVFLIEADSEMHNANCGFVYNLSREKYVLAAVNMKDRFARRLATYEFTRVQQFPFCSYAERET